MRDTVSSGLALVSRMAGAGRRTAGTLLAAGVDGALERLGGATAEEMDRLLQRVEELEGRLQAAVEAAAGLSGAGGGLDASRPPGAAPRRDGSRP